MKHQLNINDNWNLELEHILVAVVTDLKVFSLEIAWK